jgi:hypothetical protein
MSVDPLPMDKVFMVTVGAVAVLFTRIVLLAPSTITTGFK